MRGQATELRNELNDAEKNTRSYQELFRWEFVRVSSRPLSPNAIFGRTRQVIYSFFPANKQNSSMYGWIYECLRQLVLEKYGPDTWKALTVLAGEPNVTFIRYEKYDDDGLMKLVSAASEHLKTPKDVLLEMFGHHYIIYTRGKGYGDLLRCLGSNIVEWLSNVDMLHSHISSSLPEMMTPHFKSVFILCKEMVLALTLFFLSL